MTNSLRVRLLWWLLVPLAMYVFVTGKTQYDNARQTADLVQDNQLISSARMIAGEVEWVDGFLRVVHTMSVVRTSLQSLPVQLCCGFVCDFVCDFV